MVIFNSKALDGEVKVKFILTATERSGSDKRRSFNSRPEAGARVGWVDRS